jgi:GT2 family glycosyltransferase
VSRATVVVITHDRIDELSRSLDRLAELPERPPVIVIDNGSDPPVPGSLVERDDGWRLVRLPRNEGAAARNVGVQAASTPYVAFNDDDTWWESGSIDLAADLLDAHPAVAVVNARIVIEPAGIDDPICEELVGTPLHAEGGGFERRLLIGGEEELLAIDLRMSGWQLVYLPEARIHHHPSTARDPHLRRRQGIRNHLWLIWLRRPWRSALRRSWSLMRRSPRDLHTARAVGAALMGVPWVLRNRRCLPANLEQQQQLLDRAQDRSVARRYVS